MARILLLLAIGFAIWLLFRNFIRRQTGEPPPAAPAPAEDMVACARCGVNMPRSDAQEVDGKFTCRDPDHCKHAQ